MISSPKAGSRRLNRSAPTCLTLIALSILLFMVILILASIPPTAILVSTKAFLSDRKLSIVMLDQNQQPIPAIQEAWIQDIKGFDWGLFTRFISCRHVTIRGVLHLVMNPGFTYDGRKESGELRFIAPDQNAMEVETTMILIQPTQLPPGVCGFTIETSWTFQIIAHSSGQ